MRNADSTFFALLQDNPVYRFAFIGLALALAVALFLLLKRKLKAMHLAENPPPEPSDDAFAVSEAAIMQAFPAHLRPVSIKTTDSHTEARHPTPVKEAYKPIVTVFEATIPPAQPVLSERRPSSPVAYAIPTLQQTKGNNSIAGLNTNQATDNQINAILNSLTDLIFEFDEAKVCLNVWYNKSRKLAIDLDSFVGKTVTENIGAENAAEMNQALDTVIRTHVATQVEFVSFFGSGKWFLAKFNPVFDADGRYTGRITASVSEISEQKKASAQLKEKHQQLTEAQKIARIGSWWYDLRTRETYWSENLFELLEINTLPVGVNHFEYYARLVHPEDRRTVYQYFANIATSPLQELEHRIVTARGNTRYFNILRGDPIYNEHGEVARVTGIIKDVTESRLADRIIKKSQAELLEAQTIAKIGNWKWYLQEKTLSWSDEVYHIHEVPVLSQMQRGISHFKLLLRYVHPDDKNILLDFLKDPANLRRTSYEYRIITPSGCVKHLGIIIGKVRYNENGTVRNVVGTLQDVTERRTAQLNIQQTEDNYKQVLERIKLAAITLDNQGRIIFCNKHLCNLLGYTQQSMLGLQFFKHFVPENIKGMFTEWLSNGQFRSSYVNPVICANGQQRVISWQNTVVHDELGRLKQITCIGEDITNQQKDRQNLITAKEEAERSSSFKSEFLSVMSHEIRTPMNAVIGTTNLLLEESPREDQLPYLNNLKFSGENLLSIIDEILDYNKIEAGKLELSKNPLNIHQLVANIRQSFHARAAEKKIGLLTDVDTNIPAELLGDPIRLAQILNNLISNAIKFTSQGNVTIRLKEKNRSNNHLSIAFTIADTGIGISPENLDRIFEPFVQESHGQNYGGSGLGLAIVKRLVGLHNAEITATSTLGKGTQFSFVINFELAAPAQATSPSIQNPTATAPTAKPAASSNGITSATASTNNTSGYTNNRKATSNYVVNSQGAIVNGATTAANGDVATNLNANIDTDKDSNKPVNKTALPAAGTTVNLENTRFTGNTPHSPSPSHQDKTKASSQAQPLYYDLDGMTVLVVDDNKMNILIANRFLHKWKITTHEASNGLNAVDMVANNHYDLIIMDLQMPIMDGFEATRLIKQTNPKLPIIALTADAMPETLMKTRSYGMDDYMTKPFMPEILFEKVARHYNNDLIVT